MGRLTAAATLAVIAAAVVAMVSAVSLAAAQDVSRWGPVAENLGLGSGICLDGEAIVCAVVLCEDGGALTLGVLGTGDGTGGGTSGGGEQPAFRGEIAVDGQAVERDMQSRVVMGDFLHVRTPVEPGEPLWQRLRAGNRLSLSSSASGDALDYSLRGSAAELDRVSADCG